MNNLNELRKHVDNLKTLLDAPELGLFTWHEAVKRQIDLVAEFKSETAPPPITKRRVHREGSKEYEGEFVGGMEI